MRSMKTSQGRLCLSYRYKQNYMHVITMKVYGRLKVGTTLVKSLY